MYIDVVPNKSNRPATLLRESFRENGKVKKRTLANLSQLPEEAIEAIRLLLKGNKLVSVDEMFSIPHSQHHGHVQAVVAAMQRLGMNKLLRCIPNPHRDRILAMIAARILRPQSKLATNSWWKTTSLPDEFSTGSVSVDSLYKAMDVLAEKQDVIEQNLAKRHLADGQLVLYDLSSSYVEGTECPLAKRGYSRDKKKGKLQVNYGLITNREGCPVSIRAFEGNVLDHQTVMEQVRNVQEEFGIRNLVLVGDRGMITQTQIEEFKEKQGQEQEESVSPVKVITALKSPGIRKLVKQGTIQLSLFDQKNLVTVEHPDYVGERLIVCRNPFLAEHRTKTREDLLGATEKLLEKIAKRVEKGSLVGQDTIGVEVGKIIDKYKVGKHFILTITDNGFSYQRNEENVAAEQVLDGLYVIRTTIGAEDMDEREVVRTYKQLSVVEQAFRTMKTDALLIRPFFHYRTPRVKAHLLLCMLAYYVRWHMERALAPYLFVDEDKDEFRDPVLPAKPSESAKSKAKTRKRPDGTPVQSFENILHDLSEIVKNTCFFKKTKQSVEVITTMTAYQKKIFKALKEIPKL